MSRTIEVVSVNVSEDKGTVKHPVAEIVIDANGVVGDAHAGPGARQVSLLAQESIDRFAAEGDRRFKPGEFAENITLRGFDLRDVALLDRFRIDEAVLEVTQIGKSCHGDDCAIFREIGRCAMPKEGVFCRVVDGGTVRGGDRVTHLPHQLQVVIITLSDRAARGDYPDRSGPRIREMIEEYLSGKRWNSRIDAIVLPDAADKLRDELVMARDKEVDIVITTGGTGVGRRDTTPDVVTSICDKLMPGIMDHIRLKFGEHNPNALLSRAVAGVAGRTLVYTLPGSLRAVEEYMGEITKTMEHLIWITHGMELHE